MGFYALVLCSLGYSTFQAASTASGCSAIAVVGCFDYLAGCDCEAIGALLFPSDQDTRHRLPYPPFSPLPHHKGLTKILLTPFSNSDAHRNHILKL
ncbi:hypothetical protein BDQ12DRAFT_691775 [Crucibulum laeve]|uniref:Secreted protein n=1 Tax=Crucibulum laeve TaxID=68775 RepID=A0A5C3LIR4_9AGAR|nr:hypothetical protein BDQ12DRAFT_691775 [Crucibulum laeve]